MKRIVPGTKNCKGFQWQNFRYKVDWDRNNLGTVFGHLLTYTVLRDGRVCKCLKTGL